MLRCRYGGGDVSGRRLLGASLPAVVPERRETVPGARLGCHTEFDVDVRVLLPAACPDCGGDVLTCVDLDGPTTRRDDRERQSGSGRC